MTKFKTIVNPFSPKHEKCLHAFTHAGLRFPPVVIAKWLACTHGALKRHVWMLDFTQGVTPKHVGDWFYTYLIKMDEIIYRYERRRTHGTPFSMPTTAQSYVPILRKLATLTPTIDLSGWEPREIYIDGWRNTAKHRTVWQVCERFLGRATLLILVQQPTLNLNTWWSRITNSDYRNVFRDIPLASVLLTRTDWNPGTIDGCLRKWIERRWEGLPKLLARMTPEQMTAQNIESHWRNAVKSNHLEVAKHFLDASPLLLKQDTESALLFVRHLTMLEFLLEKGANVHAIVPSEGTQIPRTPVTWVLRLDRYTNDRLVERRAMLQRLLDAGAAAVPTDPWKMAHFVANVHRAWDPSDLRRWLTPDPCPSTGRTWLHVACTKNDTWTYTQWKEALRWPETRSLLSVRDTSGKTALYKAMEEGTRNSRGNTLDRIRALLHAGARLDTTDIEALEKRKMPPQLLTWMMQESVMDGVGCPRVLAESIVSFAGKPKMREVRYMRWTLE